MLQSLDKFLFIAYIVALVLILIGSVLAADLKMKDYWNMDNIIFLRGFIVFSVIIFLSGAFFFMFRSP